MFTLSLAGAGAGRRSLCHFDELVHLANYLTIIGATRGQFKMPSSEKQHHTQVRPPECVFWPWALVHQWRGGS